MKILKNETQKFYSGGFLSGGFCLGGFLSRGFLSGGFVLEPEKSDFDFYRSLREAIICPC